MVQVTGTAFDLMMTDHTLDRSAAVPEYILISHQAPMTLTPSKSRYVHIIYFCMVYLVQLYDLFTEAQAAGTEE